ncbi:MAG: bifunctional phosphopantothenoylcysteine decarboxylase/phosphopantothenate--cysteine ligase CoaBC [Thermoleophilia bacterium]
MESTSSRSAAAGRSVLVGVTGGIAAYKSVEFVRLLLKNGIDCRVVMTPAATRFVAPLTFAAVSQRSVLDDEVAWRADGGWFEHIDAARDAEVMVVAPATANTIGKLAGGIADNLLCATALAFRGALIVAPAMNWAMYEHPATRANLEVLAARGVEIIAGEPGELACGEVGGGRMAEPATLVLAVRRALRRVAAGPFVGKRVVITAGGTREAIDAVRYVGNRSSGKMGRAVADEAYLRGAEVVLVTTRPHPAPYAVVAVESASDMAAAVRRETAAAVVVGVAAVADFRPATPVAGKIERTGRETLSLDLVRTPDVLGEAAASGAVRVAFAAEAGPQLERARAKRIEKGAELLVFNDVTAPGIGMDADDNEITIIGAQREVHVPRASKSVCASAILDEIETVLAAR